jgi:hypothetical protein
VAGPGAVAEGLRPLGVVAGDPPPDRPPRGAERLTLAEVGERLGFTREWVRKIERRALAKLRAAGREVAAA